MKEENVKIQVTPEESIPEGSNPFHFDSWRMGSELVRGWMVMTEGFDNPREPRPATHFILVNTRTGQRVRLDLVPESQAVLSKEEELILENAALKVRLEAIKGMVDNIMDYSETLIEQWDSKETSDIVREEAAEELINTFIIRTIEMRKIAKEGI